MIRSISLTELISGNGVNVSYIIRPMNVLRISTSFCTVETMMLFLTYIVSKTERKYVFLAWNCIFSEVSPL